MTILTDPLPTEDHFSLTGESAILSLLQNLQRQRQTLSVTYGLRRESLLTTLLSTGPEGIVFDFGLDPASNERLERSKRLYFSCAPDGILIRFLCETPQRIVWEGEPAGAVALPRRITRLQRREYYRVIAPVARPLVVSVNLPEVGNIDLVIHDLSVGGAGLYLPDKHPLPIGTLLSEGHFRVGGADPVQIGLTMKHLTPISHGLTRPSTRLGIAFRHLARRSEVALQRWIIQLDQERRKFDLKTL